VPLRTLRRLAIDLRDWGHALDVARQTDALLMCGTGMLTDCGEGAFGLPYDLFKWSLVALVAKVCRCQLAFVSVGVEPIRHPLARFFIGAALRLANYRSYRDRQSVEYLTRIGLARTGGHVYPDLAFSLPAPFAARASSPGPRPLAVAVGVYDYRCRGQSGAADADAYTGYVEKMGAFVHWLLGRGCSVRIVIGDLAYDRRVLADLRSWLLVRGMSLQDATFEDAPAGSVSEVLEQLSGVDLVVASRFHNVLLALLLGKPVVSLSYNEKNEALMAEAGLSAYCQTLDALDLERLKQQFCDMERSAERLREEISSKVSVLRERLQEQYRTVFALVQGDGEAARPERWRSAVSAPPRNA
jgi:polysaccharide pyruvyl transferase WcaK-like protein